MWLATGSSLAHRMNGLNVTSTGDPVDTDECNMRAKDHDCPNRPFFTAFFMLLIFSMNFRDVKTTARHHLIDYTVGEQRGLAGSKS